MSYAFLMAPHFIDLAFLFLMVVLLSAGVLLWLKSLKKQPSFVVQLVVVACLIALLFAGLKLSGTSMGIFTPALAGTQTNPYREAYILLQEPYPSHTTYNNLSGVNREALLEKFQKMEQLDIIKVKPQVQALKGLIESAPASGLPGIYNMRITSDIQARWEELRQELMKRAE